MNSEDLKKILDEHQVYLTSCGKQGSRANLSCADLRSADLSGADLSDADLRSADLRSADLRIANLSGADLSGADLSDADLRSADLRIADLRSANLSCANLSCADLRSADLRIADLRSADLPDRTFVIFGEEYAVTITNGEYVRAGCQNHHIDAWRKFSKHEIAEMDGRRALKFFPRLLDVIDFYLGKGERPEWINEPEANVE
ncbi:pentapeptide repeat-containing protein [Morganella sp. GD04133]|uniref:pentapeptide repeat-containing protein n=1 Tax=Morganella sp. GD04133 TaxID=2975435 RepID=UPI00244ACD0D|nr:pentapeptide repeat-containing protein [Morganella sp. GD04133]MDH0356515.1 pentapeptide repeat-containing protein [Morganella sp. GD04133]